MKHCYSLGLPLLLMVNAFMNNAYAQTEPVSGQHKVHHVVVVWLKQAGNDEVVRQYILESKRLVELPGVLAYDIGTPAVIKRGHISAALDESYDLAISSTFESQQAFEAFVRNPEYVRVAQQILRPLVDKYKVYDFME